MRLTPTEPAAEETTIHAFFEIDKIYYFIDMKAVKPVGP